MCTFVSTYRNGVYSDADRLPHRQVETESYVERRKGEAACLRRLPPVAEGAGYTSACVRVNSRTR